MTDISLQLKKPHRMILDCIRKHPGITRVELCHQTGITAGTVTQYTKDLLFSGLIQELDAIKGNRGQPSLPLKLNATGGISIGVAFEPETIEISFINLCGELLYTKSLVHKENQPIEITVQQLEAEIAKTLREKRLQQARIFGVGYAVPGYKKVAQNKWHTVSWLESWRNVNLDEVFSTITDFPICIENNANAAALAEFYSSEASNINYLIALDFGYGLGSGVIHSGVLLRGAFGNAGEIGINIPHNDARPSYKNFLNMLQENNFVEEQVDDLIATHDPQILGWLEKVMPNIQNTIFSGLCWLDPQIIVLGGKLPLSIRQNIRDHLDHFLTNKLNPEKPKPVIECSTLPYSTSSFGAALLPFKYQLFKPDTEN